MAKQKGPSKTCRILVIPSWYSPDGGQFFQDHAQGLAEAGFDVDILVNRIMGITQLGFRQFKYLKKFNVTHLNGTRIIRSYYLKWPKMEQVYIKGWTSSTQKLFNKYTSEFGKPDLILAHSAIWAGYAASFISMDTGIPYIITEHRSRFTSLTPEAKSFLKEFYRPYIERAYKGASRIITVSDALQRTIRQYAGAEAPIQTIPNLVYTEKFIRPPNRVRDPFIVLSIGRLEHEKGMDILIEAFELFGTDLPDAELRIVGKGPREDDLKRMAADTSAGQQIKFLGHLPSDQVLKELHSAKMLAVASRFEAFGVVIIEAMATGLPVMATRSGGPQTFIPEFAGFLAGRESVPSVYVGLKNIYSHYHNYKPEKISRYAHKHFSKKAVIRKYKDLINEILESEKKKKKSKSKK